MKDVIKFYRVKEEYGFFSNFAPYPILLESFFWPTVEHYFQAKKFNDFDLQDRIRMLSSPMDAANEGRKRSNPLRSDWESAKDEVMRVAVRAKFFQSPELKKKILQTGDKKLVEHTSNDSYWADGGDGTGLNMLGVILMEIREELIAINPDPDVILPPWVAFPHISHFDMFWGMGSGEEYLISWHEYFTSLRDKAAYKRIFPISAEWEDFYEHSD
ncbi:MAG: NADAR family protein [Bacteroidota bacterium]